MFCLEVGRVGNFAGYRIRVAGRYAQTPLIRFVVDLLYNISIFCGFVVDLSWICCTTFRFVGDLLWISWVMGYLDVMKKCYHKFQYRMPF